MAGWIFDEHAMEQYKRQHTPEEETPPPRQRSRPTALSIM